MSSSIIIDDIFLQLYWQMANWPQNKDGPEAQAEKERMVSKVFLQYLAGAGQFTGWKDDREEFEKTMVYL